MPVAAGGMRLLEGYVVGSDSAVDADALTISKPGGTTIEYECGPGLRTVWDEAEAKNTGNVLLVTFLLGGTGSDYTANFKAKINQSADLSDSLLMVMTFDPSKGTSIVRRK